MIRSKTTAVILYPQVARLFFSQTKIWCEDCVIVLGVLLNVFRIRCDRRLDGSEIESRWGAIFSAPVQTGPGAHPASCTMGTGSFPGVKSGRGVRLTPHPLPVPWSRKGRAIPLLPLWAVWPVQSLIACTRVHFTFTTDVQIRHSWR
jgi:hypothetical protein